MFKPQKQWTIIILNGTLVRTKEQITTKQMTTNLLQKVIVIKTESQMERERDDVVEGERERRYSMSGIRFVGWC